MLAPPKQQLALALASTSTSTCTSEYSLTHTPYLLLLLPLHHPPPTTLLTFHHRLLHRSTPVQQFIFRPFAEDGRATLKYQLQSIPIRHDQEVNLKNDHYIPLFRHGRQIFPSHEDCLEHCGNCYLIGMWNKRMLSATSKQPMLTISVCVLGMGPSIRREAEALVDATESDRRT